MNACVRFGFCVIVVAVFGLFVGRVDARVPTVARCNHDEKLELMNRLSKRELNVFEQQYINSTSHTVSVGSIRIIVRTIEGVYDTLQHQKMACTNALEEVIANGKRYTCQEEDIGTSKKMGIVDQIDKEVVRDLQKMVNINRITGNLIVPANVYGGIFEIGNDINYNDMDLYIYVTYRPDSWDVFASGTPLVYDQNGRTIVGLLNWNPRNIDTSTSIDKKLYYNIALHEMIHILGFSQQRMMAFHNASTMNTTTGVSEEYVDRQLRGVFSDGRDISLLTSPRVQEAFREHFGCDTAEGAVLEDQGGTNVAGSHWEMAVLMDELMTATVSVRSVLTNMTLAALEDSGWYTVNHGNASHLLWGYKKGCDFVYNRCNSSWPVGDGYFCSYDSKGLEGCTYDRKGIGACDFRFWVSIPEKYRYFDDEHVGGPVEYADFCPFTYATFFCQDKSKKDSSSYGDVTGDTSRCFMSTLTDSPDSTSKQPEAPKCYPHHCLSSDSYAVKIGSYWYPCPSGESVSEVISFTGSLACPNASIFCYEQPEDKRFPIFVSVEPKNALPGTSIKITGRNLYENATITVGVPCNNITVSPSTGSINCTIAADVELSVEPGMKNIIIKQNGYSIAIPNAFTLEISTKSWILQNWFLSVCIAIAVVVIVLTVFIVTCKCCTRSRKWHKYQKSKGKAEKKKQSNEFGSDVEIDNMA